MAGQNQYQPADPLDGTEDIAVWQHGATRTATTSQLVALVPQQVPSTGVDLRTLVLTGLSTAVNAVITATDSVLSALGKLQAQLTGETIRAQNAEALLAPKAQLTGETTRAQNAEALLAPKASPSFSGTIGGTADFSGVTSQSAGSTTNRSLAARFRDAVQVRDWGAVGDGTTDDTTAVSAAQAVGLPVEMRSGTYSTTVASSGFNGLFLGPGQIKDSGGHARGKIFSTLQSAPSAGTTNLYSSETIFDGDYSRVPLAIEHRVYGAGTLGAPTTGYSVTPQAFPLVGYVTNYSGHMQDNATGDGQTGIGFGWLNGEHHGQGNMCVLQVNGQSYGSNPSATSFLSYPSIGLLAGQATAGAPSFLNPVEIHTVDNGWDSAAINYVAVQQRTNGTGANGANWIGYLSENQGSFYSDGAYVATGHYRYGVDLSATTLLTQGAVVLASGHRIYYGAANTGGFPTGTAQGQVYSVYTGGFFAHVNGAAQFSIGTTGVNSNVPLSVTGGISPTEDNAYQLGDATHRFTAVWAVTGVILTSDPSLKTDIAPIASALPLVMAIKPVTFRWIDGGMDVVDGEETREVETGEIDSTPVTDDAGNPVMINAGGKFGPPRMVQALRHTPRTETQTVKVKKLASRPGRRTHWGFLAPDVKAAFDRIEMDFGGYVEDGNGTQHLRPDQLVPVLWRAVQELSAKVDTLERHNT